MPWFPYPRQAADGILALEAYRFVRASFRIRRSFFGRALVDSDDILSVFEAMVIVSSWQSHVRLGGIE